MEAGYATAETTASTNAFSEPRINALPYYLYTLMVWNFLCMERSMSYSNRNKHCNIMKQNK